MFTRYATNNEICEALAVYRVGDIVTILHRTEFDKGIAEAGTVGTIVGVCIANNADIPRILPNQLESYYANSDEFVFEYRVELIDNHDIKIKCTAREIEKGMLSTESIKDCIKEKKRKRIPILIKCCLKKFPILLLYLCAVLAAMFIARLFLPTSAIDIIYLTIGLPIFVPIAVLLWIETSINLFGIGRIKRKRSS